MDAAGHLKRFGWRGVGHSLDLNDRGLVKPLLVSNKSDNRGVGQKKTLVSDQWWMRAFDDSLKELGSGNKVCYSPLRLFYSYCLPFPFFFGGGEVRLWFFPPKLTSLDSDF